MSTRAPRFTDISPESHFPGKAFPRNGAATKCHADAATTDHPVCRWLDQLMAAVVVDAPPRRTTPSVGCWTSSWPPWWSSHHWSLWRDDPQSTNTVIYNLPLVTSRCLAQVLIFPCFSLYISSYSVSCFGYYILLVFYLYSSCNSDVRMSH